MSSHVAIGALPQEVRALPGVPERLGAAIAASSVRTARGLPVGGDVEYADEITLSRALEGRQDFQSEGATHGQPPKKDALA